jgi:periplasmic protein CpxP/Spy
MHRRVFMAAIFAAPLLIAAAPVRAQNQGGRFRMLQEVPLYGLPPQVQARLNLTEEQKTKIGDIGKRVAEEQRQAFEAAGAGGNRQEVFQKLQASRQKANEEAAALLNADQKTQWTGMQKSMEENVGLGRSAVALLAIEGLTDEQKTKLKAVGTDFGGKRRELFQSAQGGNFQGMREKMAELDMQSAAEVRKILSADQGKVFDATLAAVPTPGRRRQNNN